MKLETARTEEGPYRPKFFLVLQSRVDFAKQRQSWQPGASWPGSGRGGHHDASAYLDAGAGDRSATSESAMRIPQRVKLPAEEEYREIIVQGLRTSTHTAERKYNAAKARYDKAFTEHCPGATDTLIILSVLCYNCGVLRDTKSHWAYNQWLLVDSPTKHKDDHFLSTSLV